MAFCCTSLRFGRVEEQHLPRVIHGVRELAVSEIPILVGTGVKRASRSLDS